MIPTALSDAIPFGFSGRNSFAGYTNHYNLVFRAVRVTSVNITSPWTVVSSRTRLASTAAAPRRREMISTSSFKGLRTDASKGISCLKSTQSLLRSTSIHADAGCGSRVRQALKDDVVLERATAQFRNAFNQPACPAQPQAQRRVVERKTSDTIMNDRKALFISMPSYWNSWGVCPWRTGMTTWLIAAPPTTKC